MKKYILLICLLAGILPQFSNGTFTLIALSETYAQFYDYEDEDYYQCSYCGSRDCNGGCFNNTTCYYCHSTNCDGSCADPGCSYCGNKDCWGGCQSTSYSCPFCGSSYCWGNCQSYGCRYCGSYSCDGSCIYCSNCGSPNCNGSCIPQGCPYCGSYNCSGQCYTPPSEGGSPNVCICCNQQKCICNKCSECGKIIQDGPTTRGTNESCDICDSQWCKGTHNRIIKNVFKGATEQQVDSIKKGSKLADKYQNPDSSYIHAMRKEGQSVDGAIVQTKDYFLRKINLWNNGNGSWTALGEALHPIMDAYAPSHKYQIWTGHIAQKLTHPAGDLGVLHPDDRKKAEEALKDMYEKLKNKTLTPEGIFDEWISKYKEENKL